MTDQTASSPYIAQADLLAERRRFFVAARGGLSLPVAGAVYWAFLGVMGFSLELNNWALVAAFGSGMIFPLGLLLQKPLRSPFMTEKSPVSGVALQAIIAINFLWPLHFVFISVAPEYTVLSLAIGMTLHWLVIGWSYASKACVIHAYARMVAVIGVFFLFPEGRLTVLPFTVSALYILAAIGIGLEVAWTRRRISA
ncbi:MAG: hypothetical protein GYB36_01285 [Alphaproteobacteria bacterium]|nr:hypothetical protein [Alphaproteobacteria bacterium]